MEDTIRLLSLSLFDKNIENVIASGAQALDFKPFLSENKIDVQCAKLYTLPEGRLHAIDTYDFTTRDCLFIPYYIVPVI